MSSPVKAFLEKNDPEGDKFRCLVTMYGIPLRVLLPNFHLTSKNNWRTCRSNVIPLPPRSKRLKQQQSEKELKALREEETQIKRKIDQVGKVFQGAAVDSELALVREDHYPLDGWLPNKYFLGYRGKEIKNMPQKVMLVSRLDGPSEEIVRRIIDDSLQTEKEGLQGKAYFDARWPDPGDKEVKGSYGFYDRAIHKAARLVEKSKRMPVVVDSQAETFSTRRVSGCSTLLRMVQPGTLRGRLYLGKGRGGVSYRQSRMSNTEE